MSHSKKSEAGLSREARCSNDRKLLQYLDLKSEEEAEKIGYGKAKKLSTAMAKDRLFLKEFEKRAKILFANKLVPSKYATQPLKKPIERTLNVAIGDTHFHSLLDGKEVPFKYGPQEEARSLSAVAVQVAEYKKQYRENTTLNVHLLGDIIQGQLHDPRDGAPLAAQSAAAIYLLSQAIHYWSGHFPKVTVRCTTGNHGRNTSRHKDRATHEKWDSIETIIYYGTKMACSTLPNVSIEIPYTPYYTYESFDQRGFVTHGDTVLVVGQPGKSLNVEKIRKDINEWNSQFSESEQNQLFLVGHVHFATNVILPNGIRLMTNGCLVPPDGFSISGGYFTTCGQWIWESVPGHIVGDSRFVVVDESIRNDKSLDKVIKPFEKF